MFEVVATYKIIHKKVPRVVAERKNWKKFGASEKDGPGPNISTTYVADEVEIQFINRFGEEMEEKSGDPLLKGQSTIVHCRFCKSDEHWSVNCPYKVSSNEGVLHLGEGLVQYVPSTRKYKYGRALKEFLNRRPLHS